MKKFILLFLLSTNVFAAPLSGLSTMANQEKVRQDKVLLYYWASWCPECKEKLSGEIQKLQTEFPNVSILTVNSDRDIRKGEEFTKEHKLQLPVYRDEEKILSKSLKIFSVPAWALLEKKNDEWINRKSANGADLEQMRGALRSKYE